MSNDGQKKTAKNDPAKTEEIAKKESAKKKVAKKKIVKKEVVKKEVSTKKAAVKKAIKTGTEQTKKAAPKKVVKKAKKSSVLNISPEERWKMIAVAAYHIAEKRNFAPGNDLQDWVEAEQEIDKFLQG